MRRATLIVQTFSLSYVENFVRYLYGVLQRHLDPDALLVVCDEIDEADHPDGVILVIGENFRPFRRRPGCRYAFVNLSVVTLLGNPLSASLLGHRQVFRKRRMLNAKLPLFDVLLDYYPPQTRKLQRQLPIPVLGFDVAIAAARPLPMAERDFDVCFVGGMTARRKQVLDELARRGLALSPQSGAPIEDIAARSRCCLNVHTERSNHLEIPRLVAAFSRGCPVVTETSFGLSDIAADRFASEYRLPALADGVEAMLADPDRLRRLGADCAAWYRDTYLPRAEARWAEICGNIAERQAGPSGTSRPGVSSLAGSTSMTAGIDRA